MIFLFALIALVIISLFLLITLYLIFGLGCFFYNLVKSKLDNVTE